MSAAVDAARKGLRHLVIVLGDQLDDNASALDGFDPARDRVWMCEAIEESTHVWSSKPRIAVFLSAMRHFAKALLERGWPVTYRALDDVGGAAASLGEALAATLADSRPQAVVLTEPGDWRVRQTLRQICERVGVPMVERVDRHFYCSTDEFARFADGRKQLRLEHFYRAMRVRHQVLMVADETPGAEPGSQAPAGGRWNFDAENREAFGPTGPAAPQPLRLSPDALTQSVIALVERRFADHPGRLEAFGWPLTREQALQVLEDFITHRLPHFGRWQDAMWAGEPWLYHSHLSVALNLKLISPREVVAAAEAAWRTRGVDLASVEGFIRQVLGWREYVRGLYWLRMPDYAGLNELDAREPLPDWYWTGQTDMACLRDALDQTLRLGYAHHIQRLMVTGLYALLLGADPQAVHRWYLAVYVDAVEWVELPNTLGMSQYADGGLMSSKPYVATGRYIDRMSNYCQGCVYRPERRVGDDACPFTTLYWDFLDRHRNRLARNPRMALQVKNLTRIDATEMAQIRARAATLRHG